MSLQSPAALQSLYQARLIGSHLINFHPVGLFCRQRAPLRCGHGFNAESRFSGRGQNGVGAGERFCQREVVSPKQIMASDVFEPARSAFTREVGGATTDSNLEVLQFASVLILAVKPDQVPAVLNQLKIRAFTEKHLLISIAAGVTLAKLEGRVAAAVRASFG